MATDLEIRKNQKSSLHDLMKVKIGKRTVDDLIEDLKAEMLQEDFAYVMQIVGEIK